MKEDSDHNEVEEENVVRIAVIGCGWWAQGKTDVIIFLPHFFTLRILTTHPHDTPYIMLPHQGGTFHILLLIRLTS